MIIPVLDIKNNECVCGKSGNRETYKKLKSIYGDNPIQIAKNLKKDGFELVYIADLDKLEKSGENSQLISQINEIIPVLLDNAVRDIDDVKNNKNITSYNIIATESINNLEKIKKIIEKCPNEELVISIDIKDEKLLINNENIQLEDIISLINKSKVKYVIILNITQIGTKSGIKSKMEESIINNCHDVKFIMAGGITNEAIKIYHKENIDNFLVGTLLHEGNLKKW